MTNEKYLFFRDVLDEANIVDDVLLVPASNLTNMFLTDNVTLRLTFKSIHNILSSGGNNVVSDYVDLTINANSEVNVVEAITQAINGSKDGFIVVADDTTTFDEENPPDVAVTPDKTRLQGEYLHPDIVACSNIFYASKLSTTTSTTGVSGGTTLWNSYGAGVVTNSGATVPGERAPIYAREQRGNDVISTIYLDITGWKAENDHEDIIGGLDGSNAAVDGAYIGKYVAASMGVLNKVEVACIELPAAASGTLLKDFDIKTAPNADGAQADDASGGTFDMIFDQNTDCVLGTTVTKVGAQPTEGEYFYIVAGAAQGTSACVYNAGKLMIRFYGTISA